MNKVRFFFQKLFKNTKYLKGQRKYNLGKRSYIAEKSIITHPDSKVGKFCTIAGDVVIGMGAKKPGRLSIHGFQWSHKCERLWGDLTTPVENVVEPYEEKPVIIGNDVWIGFRAIVLGGVKVADGAIIGAGAIVTKDVPPYAVVVGVPAKVVKYRFEADIIEKLLELKWWDYPEDFIVRLPFDDVRKCIELLEKNRHLNTTSQNPMGGGF